MKYPSYKVETSGAGSNFLARVVRIPNGETRLSVNCRVLWSQEGYPDRSSAVRAGQAKKREFEEHDRS